MFSNDFASRRERPKRPWATSTRQACRMGRNTGCLSSHPTRRISRSWFLPSVRAAAAVTPRVHQDQLKPPGDPLLGQVLQHQLTCPVLMGGGRHDQGTHREPGHVDRHHALSALRAAVRAAAVLEGEPARWTPRGRPRAAPSALACRFRCVTSGETATTPASRARTTRAGSAAGSRCGRRTASRPPPAGGPVRAWVRACRAR